jgi:hypothetical protein
MTLRSSLYQITGNAENLGESRQKNKNFYMKQIMSILITALLLGLSSGQAISQAPIHFVDMDIALEHLHQDSVTQNPCGSNTVFISFDIQNKFLHTVASCVVKFEVSNINADAVFSISSPQTCVANTKCFKLEPGQTIRVHAQAQLQNSWVDAVQPQLKISATPNNIDGGTIQFRENNTSDNTINDFLHLSNVLTNANSYCVCSSPAGSVIDTAALYIIQSYIKKEIGSLTISSATVAVPFNLRPSLTQSDASRFKFRFAGYYNSNTNMPMYTIEFSGTGILMTRDNNTLTFRVADGNNNQKWVLKKNSFGGYGIFNIKEPGRPCLAWGVPDNTPALVNSPLLLSNSYDAINVFQYFNLVKLQ